MANLNEHSASVVVKAPVHQVYSLFTHFNDFPKFMSFVKEVTYMDDANSHWVADVAGEHEWDAVNDAWIEDRQIGWHSTEGLNNFGKVTFDPLGPDETKVNVSINYEPPAGILGQMGEKLGVGSSFDSALQKDLNQFAEMVDQAPEGALDPTSSNYLFHSESAAAKGTTTDRQNETMRDTAEQQGAAMAAGAAGQQGAAMASSSADQQDQSRDTSGTSEQQYSAPQDQGQAAAGAPQEATSGASEQQVYNAPQEQGGPMYNAPEGQGGPVYDAPKENITEPSAPQDLYNAPEGQGGPIYDAPKQDQSSIDYGTSQQDQGGIDYSASQKDQGSIDYGALQQDQDKSRYGSSERMYGAPETPKDQSEEGFHPTLDRDITGINNRDIDDADRPDTDNP